MVSLIFGVMVLFTFPTTWARDIKAEAITCPYKFTLKDTIAGDITLLTAIDVFFPLPTISIVTKEDGNKQEESWWTWDEKTHKYVFLTTIRPADPPVGIHSIAQHDYDSHNKYRYYVSLNHVDGKVAMESSLIPVEPTPTDFHLNKQDDETRKDKTIIALRTQKLDPAAGQEFKAAIKQFAHATIMGDLLAYYVVQNGKNRPCLIISMVNDNKVTGLVACYPLAKNLEHPEYDDILHVSQELQFHSLPKLADLELPKQTLVIVADSAKDSYVDGKFTEQKLNVITVFAQESEKSEQLKSIQTIPLEHTIISIASVVTQSGIGYLAVATDFSVLIYRYDVKTSKLVQDQEIVIKNVKQVKFQEFNSKDVVLFVLTTEAKDNIHVIQWKEKEWNEVCVVTSPGSRLLEATSFDYNKDKRDLLFSVRPKGADVYEITKASY